MKNIKDYSVFIILICLILSINLNTAKSVDCVEDLTPGDWVCGAWESDTTIYVYLDEFDCTVEVTYDYRVCTFDNDEECYFDERKILQSRLKSIDWDWDNCDALTQYIMPGYPGTFTFQDHNFAELMDLTQEEMARLEFEDFYFNELTPLEMLYAQCSGTFPDCNAPLLDCQPFEVNYIKSQCLSICVRDCDGTNINIGIQPCDAVNNGCCEVRMSFCACVNPNDPNDITFLKYQEERITHGNCSSATPVGCPADPCYVHSDCIIYCNP